MPAPRKLTAVLAVAAVGLGAAARLGAWADPPSTAALAPRAAAGYVPDEQCASCHREIWRSYQHVGMARSFSRPHAETVVEDFTDNHYFHEPSGRHYEMTLRDGAYVFRRYQLDEEGEPIHEFEQPVDWIIGSGSHSRGYLYQTPRGELFELPLVWYEQDQRWGMAPGYDGPEHDGVTRQITRDCMFCHNGYPDVAAGSDAYGQPHLFPRDLPEGTGCQRCHGPGAEHIRLANDLAAPLEDVLAAIVNPSKLAPELRDDACYQCHLQPTSKRTSFVRRFGRDEYSYQPGEPLADYLVHLDYPDSEFEINHHPYRLRQSKCYAASDGALHCLTCHDPHRKVPPAERAAHYRERCFTCHDVDACRLEAMADGAGPFVPPDTAPDDCVACHMPARRTSDVIHVTMTDHHIVRRIEEDPLAELEETPPPQRALPRRYLPDRAPQGPGADAYEAFAMVNDGNLGAVDVLAAAINDGQLTDRAPWLRLASALIQAERYDDALMTLDLLLEREPDLAPAWTNRGVALARLDRLPEAITSLERSLELDPDAPDTHYNLAAALARLDRPAMAAEHYAEAVRMRPSYAGAWLNLGNQLARQQRYEAAAEAYREALSVEPSLTSAARNLGAALRYLGDWAEAVRVWRHAALHAPQSVTVALDLALAYLIAPPEHGIRDPIKGLRFAETAVRLAPDARQTIEALAVALLDNDRPDEAIEAARRMVERRGDPATVLLITALAHDAAGRRAEAMALVPQLNQVLRQPAPRSRVRDELMARADRAFGGQQGR